MVRDIRGNINLYEKSITMLVCKKSKLKIVQQRQISKE